MNTVLSPHQARVAREYLAKQEVLRTHVVVSLSGAHAYGFPSPDSDLDLKAIHVVPTEVLLGLGPEPRSAEHLEVIDDVEVDYTSNEVQPVLKGILGGNGNFVERVLGALQPVEGEDLASLRPLVKATLSRRLHRHYRGFARAQLSEWERSGYTSAKKLLYVLRTAMTGLHALRAGEIETDLTHFTDEAALEGVAELVAQKRRGEKSELPPALAEAWRARIEGFFTRLDEAVEVSVLPAEPRPDAVEAMEAWLLALRRRRFGS